MYKHFIIIRFSIKLKIGLHTEDVFNEKRLNARFKLFENICLPSLISQKEKNNLFVILIVDPQLPEKYKTRLLNLINNHDFIKIIEYTGFPIGNNEYLKKFYDDDTKIVITTRLDDDDALHPNFTTLIKKYADEKYNNNIISFPNGIYIVFKNKIAGFKQSNRQLISAGLTKIDTIESLNNIYDGCHTYWAKRGFKCIYNGTPNMYLFTTHPFNDSSRLKSINLSGYQRIGAGFYHLFPSIKANHIKNIIS